MKLIPKNWGSFQHYKDRSPPWIKLHKGLLNDRAYARLPIASKALAPLLWLLASEAKDGSFDAQVEELAFRLHMTEKEIGQGLNPLIKSGFFMPVQSDSNVLAMRLQVAPDSCSEGETEAEGETKAPAAFVLPDWIPLDTWNAYCKVRSGKKAKNEPHALGLIVKDLETFRAAGHNPVDVLNNSIKSSWVGVFEPKTRPSVVGVTVPGSTGRDPALKKLDEDKLTTKPPSLEVLERLAAIRQGAH